MPSIYFRAFDDSSITFDSILRRASVPHQKIENVKKKCVGSRLIFIQIWTTIIPLVYYVYAFDNVLIRNTQMVEHNKSIWVTLA